MIQVGLYSINDIKELINPIRIGGFYETTIRHNNEYLILKVRAMSYRNNGKTVSVRRESLHTNMNGKLRQTGYRNSIMFIPTEILKKHFKPC